MKIKICKRFEKNLEFLEFYLKTTVESIAPMH